MWDTSGLKALDQRSFSLQPLRPRPLAGASTSNTRPPGYTLLSSNHWGLVDFHFLPTYIGHISKYYEGIQLAEVVYFAFAKAIGFISDFSLNSITIPKPCRLVSFHWKWWMRSLRYLLAGHCDQDGWVISLYLLETVHQNHFGQMRSYPSSSWAGLLTQRSLWSSLQICPSINGRAQPERPALFLLGRIETWPQYQLPKAHKVSEHGKLVIGGIWGKLVFISFLWFPNYAEKIPERPKHVIKSQSKLQDHKAISPSAFQWSSLPRFVQLVPRWLPPSYSSQSIP